MSIYLTPDNVTISGSTYADIEPFVKYALSLGLPAVVDQRSTGGSIVSPGTSVPSVTIIWGGRFDSVVQLLTFHLTLAGLDGHSCVDELVARVRETVDANLAALAR